MSKTYWYRRIPESRNHRHDVLIYFLQGSIVIRERADEELLEGRGRVIVIRSIHKEQSIFDRDIR